MRIDKYLKVSRIIKRRSVAKELVDQGRVQINGKVAKASSPVSEGDELRLLFGHKTLVVEVDRIQEHVKKDEARELYHVIEEIKTPTYEKID